MNTCSFEFIHASAQLPSWVSFVSSYFCCSLLSYSKLIHLLPHPDFSPSIFIDPSIQMCFCAAYICRSVTVTWLKCCAKLSPLSAGIRDKFMSHLGSGHCNFLIKMIQFCAPSYSHSRNPWSAIWTMGPIQNGIVSPALSTLTFQQDSCPINLTLVAVNVTLPNWLLLWFLNRITSTKCRQSALMITTNDETPGRPATKDKGSSMTRGCRCISLLTNTPWAK